MELYVIDRCDVDRCFPLHGDYVLQVKDDYSRKVGRYECKKFYLLNVKRREKCEILPGFSKYDFIRITNCKKEHMNLFFVSCTHDKAYNTFNYNIIRYSFMTGEYDIVYDHTDRGEWLEEGRNLHIFVLDKDYFLFQQEIMDENDRIHIETWMYDIVEKTRIDIFYDDVLKNGIDEIINIEKNMCLIKTGFSAFADDRFDFNKSENYMNEQLSLINLNQFISELLINKKITYKKILEKSSDGITLPYIIKGPDYYIYSRLDMETHEETVTYKTLSDGEESVYIHKDVYRPSDIYIPSIVGGRLYYLLRNKESVRFVDPETMAVEYDFKDGRLKNVVNGFIIAENEIPFGVLKKTTTMVEVIDVVGADPVYYTKGEYVDCVSTNPDNLAIFVK